MPLPSNLSHARLRDLAVRVTLGEPVPSDDVAAMIETLETLLDEAQAAEEGHGDIDDLHGIIERLEKLREEAVEKLDAQENEHEQKLDEQMEEHEKALDELRGRIRDVEEACDEYRARAEKAEADAAKTTKHGHALDAEAAEKTRWLEVEIERLTKRAEMAEAALPAQAHAITSDVAKEVKAVRGRGRAAEKRVKDLEAEVAKVAEDLKVEREYSATLHAEVRELQAENARLKEQAERAADWWKRKVAEEYGVELDEVREHAREQGRAREEVERERARLFGVLRNIVAGEPKDAHRQARVAIGREILEEIGTAAREGYVPTRAERRRGAKR